MASDPGAGAGAPQPEPQLVLNEEAYEDFLSVAVPAAERFVWILTADLKDLHVRGGRGRRYVPFLKVLADLIAGGVEVRLVHAKEPGERFRRDFDRHPALVESGRLDRILCPRMHMKVVLVDGHTAYVGSANLTGAGIGAKAAHNRNFEAGFVTRERGAIARLMDFVDALYQGDHCVGCGRREVCPDPVV